jgi:transposase
MSNVLPPIPRDTLQAGSAKFDSSNAYILLGDQAHQLYRDVSVEELSLANSSQQHITQLMYALITAFQYREHMNDRQAADALRSRVEWKYALHLPLNHREINPTELCQFRIQIYTRPKSQVVFEALLRKLGEAGFLAPGALSNVINFCRSVCSRTRYTLILESMQLTLEELAEKDPDLLRKITAPGWYSRYHQLNVEAGPRFVGENPQAAAEAIGADIQHMIYQLAVFDPPKLSAMPEVGALRQILMDQFEPPVSAAPDRMRLKWSTSSCIYWGAQEPLTLFPQRRCQGIGEFSA